MKSGQGAEKGYESAFGRGLLRAGRGIAVAAVGIVVAARVALAAVAPGDGGLVDQMPKSVAEPSKAAAARALFADRGSFVRELTAPHARTHKRATTAQAGGNGAVVPPVKREAPVTPPAEQKPTPQAQPVQPQAPAKKPEAAAPAQPQPAAGKTAPSAETGGVFGAIQDWLARANRDYQGVLMKQLSQPAGTTGAPGTAAKQPDDSKKADEAKRAEDDKKIAAEAKRLEDERKKSEAAVKTGEARKLEAQKIEDAKKAEAQKAEAQKAEAQKAEAAKKAEAAPKPDDSKAAAEARLAEEAKTAETLKAGVAQELKDAERVAEERRRQEQARIEEQKKQEAARLAQERRQAEARVAEDKRKSQDAEAAKHRNRAIVIVPEPIPRPAAKPIPGRPVLVKPDKVAKDKPPTDTRQAEGSAETGPVDREVREPGTKTDRARHCRAAGRLVTPPATYIVKRGDSLWRISARHYHKGRLYTLIWRANRKTISDPNLIYPCQSVLVPRKR